MPTANVVPQPFECYPNLYATSLKIEGEPSLLLDVEADSALQAAETAANEWLRRDRCPAGAAIYVRPYLFESAVSCSIPCTLSAQALLRVREEWASAEREKQRYNHQLDEGRRRAMLPLKQLAVGRDAKQELNELLLAFEQAAQTNTGLIAVVPSSEILRGSGALQFRGLARQGAKAIGHIEGNEGCNYWMNVVVGFLLANDDRGEFIHTCSQVSWGSDEQACITESYTVRHPFTASARFLLWLLTAIPTSNPSKAVRGAVRRGRKLEAIDKYLKAIAEAKPRSHKEVFQRLQGRCDSPRAEPFNSAGGWLAGYQRDPARARVWLSKNWGRLHLPSFRSSSRSR